MKRYDLIVIGAGPSGISASIYAKRANLDVIVFYYGKSELERASKIENYYGFENGINGEELYNIGIKQAKNLGVEVLEKEIINIEIKEDGTFEAKTINEDFISKSIILATGNKKTSIRIKGIEKFEGKGISYCAICDGFFYKGKNVAVIGNGDFAIHEASDLVNIVNDITILTNGKPKPLTDKYKIDSRKIKQINGEKKVTSIEFEDGNILKVDGVFIAEGIAGGGNFAKKLGVIVDKNSIVVDENMETNIKGIFAVGDLTGGLLQVNKAVYEGSKAGIAVANYLKELNNKGYH